MKKIGSILLLILLIAVCVLIIAGRDPAVIAQGGSLLFGPELPFFATPTPAPTPEPTPEPTPIPTPTPTPEPYADGFDFLEKHYNITVSSLDMTGATETQVKEVLPALPYAKSLQTIRLGNESDAPFDWELIRQISDAAPNAILDYSFSLYGYNEFNLKDEKLDLRKIPVNDDGTAVETVLPCMHRCTFLDMDSCGVGTDRMVEIRDKFPDVKVVWRIEFGAGMTYSLRTDATTCLASLSGGDWGQGPRDPEDVWGLQYCTDMKYLDLGHNNNLRTIFFCEYMPDLEVLILSRDHLLDLTPLQNCKKLRYLELFWNPLDDITPLTGLENITDLMISGLPNLTDMSCLVPADVMPKINRLWVGTTTDVPHSQIEEFQKNHPNCIVNDTDNDIAYEWRYKEINHPESTGIPNVLWPQYIEIREIFGYDYNPVCYSFAQYDPYWYTPHGQEIPGRYDKYG